MIGTFSPQAEPYAHVMPEETTPSGIFARGSYSAKTQVIWPLIMSYIMHRWASHFSLFARPDNETELSETFLAVQEFHGWTSCLFHHLFDGGSSWMMTRDATWNWIIISRSRRSGSRRIWCASECVVLFGCCLSIFVHCWYVMWWDDRSRSWVWLLRWQNGYILAFLDSHAMNLCLTSLQQSTYLCIAFSQLSCMFTWPG